MPRQPGDSVPDGTQEGNPASSQRTTAFPLEDWNDLLISGLESDIEAYRSYLPNYVDEGGNPPRLQRAAAQNRWQKQTRFPFTGELGGDAEATRHDQPLGASRLISGLESDIEAYRSYLPNYVDEGGNPPRLQRAAAQNRWQKQTRFPFTGELGGDAEATRQVWDSGSLGSDESRKSFDF